MNQPMISRRSALFGATALAASPILAACSGSADEQTVAPEDDNLGFAGIVLGEPLAKPTIAFTDSTGQPFDLVEQTRDQLTLLFFGYTSCPDVCPITLSAIDVALQDLAGPAADAMVVFVGVDVERDTPARMTEYLQDRGPRFVGLNPGVPLAELNQALTALLLPDVEIDTPDSAGDYLVGHPSQVLAFGTDNTAHIMYPYGVTTADWKADLPRLAEFDWPITTR